MNAYASIENDIPEYLPWRCCMCPNDRAGNDICRPPKGWDPVKYAIKPCRFVKSYIDERGRIYKVIPGKNEMFKIKYQKPGESRWIGVKSLEWRDSFDEAQGNLNLLAEKKKWKETS